MSGPVLVLDQVTKRFRTVAALEAVDLQVGHGELVAIVGPSGCGKSTMLRSVAGLTTIDSGRIVVGGRDVAGPGVFIPPEERHIGVVFQDLALFPHLDVAGNVAFGVPRGERRSSRAREVLDLVGLTGLESRYPHELSGGEQQRVALARALAPRPDVVLLDEPFSHLDRNLRMEVRDHTIEVLRAAAATGVFVTHDQEEAMAVGDRVAVMRSGRFEQVAAPETVFHAPVSRFVATFLGEADFVAGTRFGTRVDTVLGQLPVTSAGTGRCEVMLRPHELTIDEDADGDGIVERTDFRGAVVMHHVTLSEGSRIRAQRPHTEPVKAGTRVRVRPVLTHPLVAFAVP
ncbi:MAG: ABC transporter ATP-binding protein [Nocardioidaceae bacterium]|nr:ABC transporter ATP-binding protein [Nocardioidaceae bacterium]